MATPAPGSQTSSAAATAAPGPARPGERPALYATPLAYVRLLRPAQWSKNVFVLAGVIFGHKLLHLPSVVEALFAFVCFSLLSSAVYILNDIHDRNEDRLHPRKRLRPIAAGQIGIGPAMLLGVGLLGVSLVASYLIGPAFAAVALAYLLLQLAYTLALKHLVLLDIIAVGLGFVLRAVAGAVAVSVTISPWLVICTFTLCLFMGFSKRRCELNILADNGAEAGRHRRTLSLYTRDMLNHFTTLTAGIAVVGFMLYATDERTVREFHTHALVYTLPIVVYAIFRFAFLVEHGEVDGPTDVLMRDRPFQVAIVLWTAAVVLIIYYGPQVGVWARPFLHSGG